MIKVNNQHCISELGKRTNNEDNFGYIQGATYVVCDGVGGSDKGEVASQITVKTFIEAFKLNTNADASEVLQLAESNLTAYVNKNDHVNGMATTLTFSQIRENGIYVAWVGDSRVYQFRDGQIIFQTTDHSWINEALRSGILTPEEAIGHPKAHVITRAIQGSHKPTTADTILLTDIKKGDLFLHCSDGVLETWSNEDLTAVFASLKDPAIILAKIKNECALNSKDNFTAIVYQIEEANISEATKSNTVTKNIVNNPAMPKKGSIGKEKKVYLFAIILLLLAIPLSVYLTSLYFTSKADDGKKSDQVKQGTKVNSIKIPEQKKIDKEQKKANEGPKVKPLVNSSTDSSKNKIVPQSREK
jgi:protein phosphatase